MENLHNKKVEKLIDKVRKLLALADNNPSEAEAQTAALRAQELISKYNLSLVDTEKELKMHQSAFTVGEDKSWKYDLASMLENNFRVKSYWKRKRIVVFYGYKQDAEVAKEVFKYLFSVCEKNARRECRKAYKMYGTEKGVYYSYTRGFISGVSQKLGEQCRALMIVTPPEVNDKWEEFAAECNMKSLNNTGNYGSDGFRADKFEQGYIDGRLAMKERELESGKR